MPRRDVRLRCLEVLCKSGEVVDLVKNGRFAEKVEIRPAQAGDVEPLRSALVQVQRDAR